MTRPLAARTDFVLLLGGLSALTATSIDIILPATGVIAAEFDRPPEQGALLIGAYLLAYGAGQLFWGLYSDAFGRLPALRLSLAGFLLATLACAVTTDFRLLLGLRVLQGLMGGAPVIARAMARDIGTGETAARLFAVIMGVTAVAPMIAPVLGAALISLYGWRACFVFLLLMAGWLMVLSARIAVETVPNRRPERFSLGFLAEAIPFLFSKRPFLAGLLVSSFTFGGYAGLLSLGAVVVETTYGRSPAEFSTLFALGAGFVVLGTVVVRALVGRIGLGGVGRAMAAALGLAVAAHALLLFAAPSLTLFWSATCLYFAAFGLALPASQALALEPAQEMAGFASSILGASLMIFGGLGAGLALLLFDGSHRAISGAFVAGGGLALASFLALGRRAA